jgi:Putative transposase/Transposase zinc-binding domain
VSGELGALLRTFLDSHLATHAVPADQRRILRALARCGTGELGYADYHCPDCDRIEHVPRGCGNRHCPRCQGRLARAWLERQQAALLDTAYFHAVFTLPHALLPLCVARPAELYRLLFDAAAQTLLRLGRERLGGTVGLTAVLHTWGQPLNLHPHLHVIVTGGALDSADHWHAAKRRGYLFPLGVMSAIFRGKFLAGLTVLKVSGAVPAPPGGWPKLWQTLGRSPWVVYCKRPFAGPEQVLSYLSNYTHRVAISERRIVACDAQARTVTFRWRDYRCGGAPRSESIDADRFLRRFRRHLLPRGFTKVRHYGLLANHARSRLVPLARAAIGTRDLPPPKQAPASAPAWPPPCVDCGGSHVRCCGFVLPNGHYIAVRLPLAAAPTKVREPP